jgi:hypothetical protein
MQEVLPHRFVKLCQLFLDCQGNPNAWRIEGSGTYWVRSVAGIVGFVIINNLQSFFNSKGLSGS